MPLSPAHPGGIVRKPRPEVAVNGVRLPASAVISVEVTNSSHFTADTYRVHLSISGLPPAFGPAYWAESQDDLVSVAVSIDGGIPQQLILGQVDDAEIDLVGRTISLTGRDLSSRFLDAKTAEKFQNLTASDIALQLSLRQGLDADVVATSARAGTYYEIDHAVLTREQTEWDLLVYLAEREGFDVWVSGTTLHFRPAPVEASTPYVLFWSEPNALDGGTFASNATDIRLQRSQTLAKDIIVIVRSWNQKQQKGFSEKASASQAKGQRRGGKAQVYTFIRPNLTPDQALALAKSLAEQITRHERLLSASLPADNILSTRTMVQLVGTNTAFDQLYYPDTVTRRLSMQEGYRMELRAKNHSTLSDVAL
ncbi:phage late control D family protein [Tundrisphaera sp. TA3]|uniref:phage late control D family protein n=1 Tax=Tundrisphaera sp. TA3 TaxID=3435775 RepID=UPI003EB93343